MNPFNFPYFAMMFLAKNVVFISFIYYFLILKFLIFLLDIPLGS